ncbi:MAG TPA: hypothetical protein VHX13_01775 [Acidobacteriaceae bacterium]|nr:hypothetical protein [Acidobacteriaceae bacterium]
MNLSPTAPSSHATALSTDHRPPRAISLIALSVWLVAGAVAFLPFAFNTSAWDAVTFRVPGNQGNWWHFLAGAPFFLAFPMIWLRLRSLFSARPSTATERRVIRTLVGLSILGTLLVESPFLLHLAGTSEWQRLIVLSLGLGIVIASAVLLLLRRRNLLPTQTCLIGLNTAWLANAALCLVVYAAAAGTASSRSGWFVSIVIVWPMLLELVWLFLQSSRAPAPALRSRPL